MRTLRLLLLAAVCVLPAVAAEQLGLREGEALTYRVSWGIFPNAGEINVTTASEINDGVPQTVVTTHTSTKGVLKRLFPFSARAESIFNRNTGRLEAHTEASASGKKRTNLALVFDYDALTARYSDYVEPQKNTTVPIPPPGYPKDLITTLIHTRTWDLQPGEKRDADVVFEDDIYQLTIYALGYEIVETPLGRFKTLKLEPRMEKTPPLGMFRRGSKVHVWIAVEDARRLPVKFEVEFKFGVGISTLVDYQPPDAARTASNPSAVLSSAVLQPAPARLVVNEITARTVPSAPADRMIAPSCIRSDSPLARSPSSPSPSAPPPSPPARST